MKICLAGSGGGHLRQLMDLKEVWQRHDASIVSEDTIFARSVYPELDRKFVTPFALGQLKTTGLLPFITLVINNLIDSTKAVRTLKPELVISTGAGSVFLFVLLSRLSGSRVVLIETFSRYRRLSKFAKFSAPLSHIKVLQTKALAAKWPSAPVFDPVRILPDAPPPKQNLIFVTVGASLPFDRLLEAILLLKAAGKIPERVIIQGGATAIEAAADDVELHRSIPFDALVAILRDAAIVVCHGGSGSILPALQAGCCVVAMPRRPEYGEHFDDHQDEITAAFAERGIIGVAQTTEQLEKELERARNRKPVVATSDTTEICRYLSAVIAGWLPNRESVNP